MKKNSRANKGQFFVIAALLVSVILVGGVISTYTWVRHPSVSESPDVLGAIGEMNTDIKSVLDFTVGYYGSILQVTGNSSYAQGLTTNYLSSGLVNIARSHPEWNPSFSLNSKSVTTNWFMPESSSTGEISVTYSLGALGIEGVTYETSSALTAEALESEVGQARINVTRDNSEPELGLTTDNFGFYNYSYADSTWELVNPSDIIISANGVYNITLPNGVGPDSYSVQIEDNRGLLVSVFYSQASVDSESRIPHYTYDFSWDSVGVQGIYENLVDDNFVIELLQNGTLRWLGQPLEVTSGTQALPPVSVKAFRVNATTSSGNHQIPFQVEDWASDYAVPLGLSGNDSLFTNTNMLVFLVNNDVDKITLWWEGNDTAIPTPYAHQNNINGDVSNTYNLNLSNDNIGINVAIDSANLQVTSTDGSTSNFAEFLRINGNAPVFHAGTSVVIHNGSIRAILQQEPEYSSGATNMYSQLILTLPVNTTYYTYTTRLVFVDSADSLHRSISDLSVVQLSSEWINGALKSLTENGTSGIYPQVTETNTGSTDLFDNSTSSGGWEHRWTEYVLGDVGGGLMVPDRSNIGLYSFDDLAEDYTGALSVTNQYQTTWTTPTSVYDNCGEDASHLVIYSIDNNWWSSYWSHSTSENHWITFDLGDTLPISRISIYQPSYDTYDWGGTSGIQIFVSDDPESWGSPVWSGRIDGYQWEDSAEFSAEGRYVKLVSLSTSSSQRLYEVQFGTQERSGTIEFNPVEVYQVTDFNDALDLTWFGAVVLFGDDPIYPDSGSDGLWVMVEHPPTVSMD